MNIPGGSTASPPVNPQRGPEHRPRILLVAPDFHSPTGASPRIAARWAREHEVLLFRGRDVGARGTEFRALAETCDLVHWHANLTNFPNLLDIAASLSGKVPQLAAVHHMEEGEEDKVRALEEVADAIHVPSSDVAMRVDRLLGTVVPVLTMPYLVDRWATPHDRRLEQVPGRVVVGWCGQCRTLTDRKRLGVLLDALARARAWGIDVRLVVQGSVPDGLVRIGAEQKVPVALLPWVRDRDRTRVFTQIDLYVSPSAIEGGPLPVFEAAALWTPVATTPVGMAADLLERGGALRLGVDDPEGQALVFGTFAGLGAEQRAALAGQHRRMAWMMVGRPGLVVHERAWSLLGGSGTPRRAPIDAAAWNRTELQRDRAEEGRQLLAARRRRDAVRELAGGVWGLPRDARREVSSALVRSVLPLRGRGS